MSKQVLPWDKIYYPLDSHLTANKKFLFSKHVSFSIELHIGLRLSFNGIYGINERTHTELKALEQTKDFEY